MLPGFVVRPREVYLDDGLSRASFGNVRGGGRGKKRDERRVSLDFPSLQIDFHQILVDATEHERQTWQRRRREKAKEGLVVRFDINSVETQ